MSNNNLTQKYITLYQNHKERLLDNSSQIVNEYRDKAFDAFKKSGIPTVKSEAYKYTNIEEPFSRDYQSVLESEKFSGNIEELFKCNVEELDTYTMFTVNGKFIGDNNPGALPEGVIVGGFAEMAEMHPAIVEKYYGKSALIEKDGVIALNTMLATDGLFIYVPSGIKPEKPLQVVNILTAENDILVNRRDLIVVEGGADLRLLFCDHTISTNRFLVNAVTEGFVADSGTLDFYNLQNQHNGTVQIGGYYFQQDKKSLLNANYFSLNSGIARNNVFVDMNGLHGENHISGLTLVDKNQHVDNFLSISHNVPECESNELFKSVLDDAGSGAFTGRIYVAPDAQKTNAYQSNNNLLLTDTALMNARPQLEIYADDVKCSHGATVGQLDEEALFYLRARGIGKDEATILLMYAFAYEVIEKIRVPALKEQIRTLVEKRFRGELDKCDSCIVCADINKVMNDLSGV
ncbi:Fe-S cluster assembly protein SufD [Marinilabiliaceae bacterium ANBcel2]|nr:Fe-S cluster assembly protein SufD [Marinilabiliaceae bacterium ANBcel2]